MSQLVAVQGPLTGKTYNLQKITVLGRSFDADVRVDDLTVSRHHAKVAASPQGFMIEDMGSGNGTFVNDQEVESATPLKDGDLIRISQNIFRFAGKDEAPRPDTSIDVVELSESQDSSIVETLDIKSTLMDVGAPRAAQDPESMKKAHDRLRTVVSISNAVQSELDLDRLLNEIMDSLFHVFSQADRGFIMLKDEQSGELVPKAARQRGKEKPTAISVSRHVIDDVVAHRIAVLTADAMGDDRFSGAVSVVNFQIRSMMCAPLIANDDFLGVIHIDTVHQDRRFTMDDLDLLTGVANQTAFAIGNAKLHNELMRRQRVERDLDLARQVQESFLPGEPPTVEGFELVAKYRAALEVGGDFYDFIAIPNGQMGIGLGDVAGKGVPAALMMARMSSEMRSFAVSDADAGVVLTRLNAKLAETSPEGAFVTAIFIMLDPKTKTLTISNAAHCLPVLRKGSNGEVLEVDEGGGFPLGAMDDTVYETGAIRLESGDVLVIFSDGIIEAMNANKDLYGTERLLKTIARPAANAEEIMANVLDDVGEFVGDTPQSDDLTMVCIGAV